MTETALVEFTSFHYGYSALDVLSVPLQYWSFLALIVVCGTGEPNHQQNLGRPVVTGMSTMECEINSIKTTSSEERQIYCPLHISLLFLQYNMVQQKPESRLIQISNIQDFKNYKGEQ